MWTDRWRRLLPVTVLAVVLGPTAGRAGTPSKPSTPQRPVDMGLLEFLGSADPTSDEKRADAGSWMVYLSKLNLGKVPKAGGQAPVPAPAPKPATAAGASSGGRSR